MNDYVLTTSSEIEALFIEFVVSDEQCLIIESLAIPPKTPQDAWALSCPIVVTIDEDDRVVKVEAQKEVIPDEGTP